MRVSKDYLVAHDDEFNRTKTGCGTGTLQKQNGRKSAGKRDLNLGFS